MTPHHQQLPATLSLALAGLMASTPGLRAEIFERHHEQVLGTSFDLVVNAKNEAAADAVERTALSEIDRLAKILSHYDPESELARLNRSRSPMACSRELFEVLQAYQGWGERSQGAYSPQSSAFGSLWREASRTGKEPSAETLAAQAGAVAQPAWKLDPATRTVTRLTDLPLDLSSLGKGFILGQALHAAQTATPDAAGILLNIGGDIAAAGDAGTPDHTWTVGICDPRAHADNSTPLGILHLKGGALAASAAYERGYDVAGRHYSHIVDARTGRPAEGVATAVVTCPDHGSANALATTLCILPPEEGLRLASSTAGAEALIIGADGREWRTSGFKFMEDKAAAPMPKSAWEKDQVVTLNLTLKSPNGGRYKRPYVCVWVEDPEGKPIRTLSVWGNKPKYLRDMTHWWGVAPDHDKLIQAIARATRQAGKHTIEWDGRDDAGAAVKPGEYQFVVEVAREHGTHQFQRVKLACGGAKTSATIPAGGEEFEAVPVEFGPRTAAPAPTPTPAPKPAPAR